MGAGPEDLWAFEGRWDVSRAIEDRSAGQSLRFSGTAQLTRADGGLRYYEWGALELGHGQNLRAERVYFWRAGPRGVEVFFDDGRPFHTFSLSQPISAAHHLCAPDTYRVAYDFTHWPVWSANWSVSGPRKDYTMLSTYRRG